VHVATGSELVAPETHPVGGQIRDTNSSLLAALFAEAGVRQLQQARCGDDPDELSARADRPCDLLAISGGASVGDYDFGAAVLRRLGFTIHFDRVNLRPGKPLTFATRGTQAAFVIPGNPVSHFVCFHVAIRLALEVMQGARTTWDFIEMEVGEGGSLRADRRETFWPATVVANEGKLVAQPRRWSSSGDTFSLAETNALIRLRADVPPGRTVPVQLLGVPGR
jgi:molybdopterin molybdotransferase